MHADSWQFMPYSSCRPFASNTRHFAATNAQPKVRPEADTLSVQMIQMELMHRQFGSLFTFVNTDTSDLNTYLIDFHQSSITGDDPTAALCYSS